MDSHRKHPEDFSFDNLEDDLEDLKPSRLSQLPPTPTYSQPPSPSQLKCNEIKFYSKESVKNESVRALTTRICIWDFIASSMAETKIDPNYKVFAFAIYGLATHDNRVRCHFLEELEKQKVQESNQLCKVLNVHRTSTLLYCKMSIPTKQHMSITVFDAK